MTPDPVQYEIDGAGVRLAVTERGDPANPTVVLVHGWPDTKALWNPIAEPLAAGHHVVAYDVRGAGGSSHPTTRDAYRVEVLMDDLAAVVDATSPDRPVHIVGHDWGAVQGWEAVVSDRLEGRLASFTSISGPGLDHAGHALRVQLRSGLRGILAVVNQLVRFSYILTFATPLPRLVRRLGPESRINRAAQLGLGRALEVVENHPPDPAHPAATVAYDAAHGTQMYLANILRRLRRPNARHAHIPVQIIEATRDPVVRKASIDAAEPWVTNLWRRPITGGHWLVRSHAEPIAEWIAEFVAFTEGGPEPDGLRRARVHRPTARALRVRHSLSADAR